MTITTTKMRSTLLAITIASLSFGPAQAEECADSTPKPRDAQSSVSGRMPTIHPGGYKEAAAARTPRQVRRANMTDEERRAKSEAYEQRARIQSVTDALEEETLACVDQASLAENERAARKAAKAHKRQMRRLKKMRKRGTSRRRPGRRL